MRKPSYWDKNPGYFRIFALAIALILMFIIIYNVFKDVTTIYSGTNYTPLPSKFYITKPLICDKITNISGKVSTYVPDTIGTGSFLIGIKDNQIASLDDFNNVLNPLKDNDTLVITVFNIRNSDLINDELPKLQFKNYTENYRILKKNFRNDAIRYLTEGVFLGFLEKGGATERAGLKPGDILLDIKDKALKTNEGDDASGLTLESLNYLRSFKSGEIVPYKILRNNQEIMFDVRLAVFGIQLIVFLTLLCGLSIFALGFFLLMKKPNLVAARLTGFAFLLIGFQFGSSMGLYPPEADIFSFIKIYLNNVTIFLLLPIVFHSLDYFPWDHSALNKKKYLNYIQYSIGIILFIVFSIWFFINYKTINNKAFLISLSLMIVFDIVTRIIYSRYESTERRRVSRIININWVLIFVLFFLVPLIRNYVNFYLPSWYQYSFLAALLTPVTYTYIISRYKLLDIKFQLNKNIQYTVITVSRQIILISIFIILVSIFSKSYFFFPNINISGTNIELLSVPLEDNTNMLYNKIFFMVVSVISALVLYRIEKISKKYFDKKYYRQKFDYKYAQTELVKLLESKFTIESLAKLIIEKICDLVHLKRGGAVFFPSDGKLWDNKSYCYDSLEHVDFCFKEDADIINSIKKFSGPFSVDYLNGDFKYTLKQNGFKYILPFKTQERLVGALFIGEKLSEIPLNNEDIEFLESIVAGASVAIENAFLYEELTEQERFKQELEIAHRIQLASLPQKVPVILGLDICAASLPALEVGGDFYDFLNGEEGKITVIIGDVSGKGTSAALYMSKIQGILQTLNEFSYSPSQLLTRANKLIYKHIDSKSFITVAGATFDTANKTMSLARAGHLPLFHFNSKNNSIRKMQPGGIGIGLSDDETFKESLVEIKLDFQNGDIFLLVSDGITESINKAGEQFGEKRLINYLVSNNNLSSKQICEGILSNVKNFSEDMKQIDDITLVVVKAE